MFECMSKTDLERILSMAGITDCQTSEIKTEQWENQEK